MDNKTYFKINDWFSVWDPIGLGLPMSKDEYKGYIPKVYNAYLNGNLRDELIIIMEVELGLSFNRYNPIEEKHLNKNISLLEKILSNR